MKIAFDVNGVLRDTFGKMEQVYQKFMIDDYIKEVDHIEYINCLIVNRKPVSNAASLGKGLGEVKRPEPKAKSEFLNLLSFVYGNNIQKVYKSVYYYYTL